MRTALFAVIVTNIVCAFDALMYKDTLLNSMINKDIFTNLSTAIVTYVKLKDRWSLKEPSYINEFIEENTAYSTMSLKMVATLLVKGAKEGLTQNELMSYWNITDKISLNNQYLPKFIFLNNIKDIALYIRTTIYVQNSVNLTADFSSICINEPHCSISKIDFRNNEQAAKTINSWVQETTNNQILHVISSDNIDKDTKIMLVNTVYLNIGWPNLPKEMEDRIFYVSSSKMFLIPTIKFEKSMYSYGEIPHWNCKFIEIPSLNDNITMTIFLPNDDMEIGNVEYLIKKFDFDEFQLIRTAYLANNFESDKNLYLPKFTIQCTQNITNYFRWNGMITMFRDNADFTRLSEIPLKVSNIVEKVSVRVHEKKSEVDKNRERILRKESEGLMVDRPFLYIVEIDGQMEFVAAVRAPDFTFRFFI